MANLRYAPEFRVTVNDAPIPAALRGSITSVSLQDGIKGADRVELQVANENLRWLDHPLLALDNKLTLFLGYAPDPLERVFTGEIVSHDASFPGGGTPTLTVAAQDFLHRAGGGTKRRWFGYSTPAGHFPHSDVRVAATVAAEHALVPSFDPVGAALSVLLGRSELQAAGGSKEERQKLIRKQDGEDDLTFLGRIAAQNGWDMFIDHRSPLGGYRLRFQSSLARLAPDVTLRYGQSLIDFSPRISKVDQVMGVTLNVWVPWIKTSFAITVGWDWDRMALTLEIQPTVNTFGSGRARARATLELVEEPVTLASAPRVILSKLLPRLNERLTGSGTTVGDPRLVAGNVLRLEGLGVEFGGLYRITGTRHTIDGGGYRTSFDVRKEIWFGTIPLVEQGAVAISALAHRALPHT
jgi:uncharacterized protein